jgi:WD40 repeat protein
VKSLSLSPDESHFVSGSADKFVLLWKFNKKRILNGTPYGFHFKFEGSSYETHFMHFLVVLIDILDWLILHDYFFSFVGHTSEIKSVAFSPSGKNIVSGSLDRTIRIWDAVNCGFLPKIYEIFGNFYLLYCSGAKEVIVACASEIYAVVFTPDGSCILSGGKMPETKGDIARLLTVRDADGKEKDEIEQFQGGTVAVNI